MILNEILEYKRKEIEEAKRVMPLSKICELAAKNTSVKRSLKAALMNQEKKIHLICELKQASPSEGLIRKNFDPEALAQDFEAAGASAISVVTEQRYFKGSPKTLRQIRPITSVPLLRKDFVIDPYQIYETVLLGGDAVLIIAILVTETDLNQMLLIAKKLNLEVLVEVHTPEELERTLAAGSELIGINNRNLKTLEIDHSVSEHLIRRTPKDKVVVIESGIENRKEIVQYQKAGGRCFLIGTSLMKASNVKKKIRELLGETSGVTNG